MKLSKNSLIIIRELVEFKLYNQKQFKDIKELQKYMRLRKQLSLMILHYKESEITLNDIEKMDGE